jgi:hypothetical protein
MPGKLFNFNYVILEGADTSALRGEVVELMCKPGAWRPVGGVAVSGGRFYRVLAPPRRAQRVLYEPLRQRQRQRQH